MSSFDKDHLLETRNQLINEITSLSDERFNKRVDENGWSIAQVCHHLVLTEEAFTKAILHGLSKEDCTKAERKDISPIMDRSRKIKAPDIVKPASEPIEVKQVLDMLNNSRNKFLAVYNRVHGDPILSEKSTTHPVFGKLPLDQWVELLYLHEKRHIEQIKEIIGIYN